MKPIYVTLLLLLSSCNYKQLGCIVCHKQTKTTISRHETGEINTITTKKYITKAIDTPVKIIFKEREYNIKRQLIRKEKNTDIGSVWGFNFENSRSKEVYFYRDNDTIRKEVKKYRNDELVKVKRRN